MHGMAAEEEIIREAAARLKGLLPSAAVAARVGRGSFLVFLAGETDQLVLAGLARAIIGRLAAGLEAGRLTLTCACHSGIALAPADGATASELLASAELALAAVREQDTPGYGFFDPASAAAAVRRREVQRAVATAHATSGFRLVYQPVYAMRTGELTGFEALMRLDDKELGAVPPSEFIPAAEQAGLIASIGEWALEEACRSAAMWPSHLVVAVNLSPAQFLAGTIVQTVRASLERHQLPSYRLEVEITEGTLMKDSDLVLGQLRILREMGVGVALDDFGTGYSSLSYLWKFPFSKLKIDRSFVLALEQSLSAKGILRSIVKLGHGLGMTVTAEGIESPRQLTSLRELGCDLAQGYLLGRPAAPDELAAIIMRNFAFHVGRKARDTAAASTGRSA
jgi:EAL domain-containing protein (putative c-di-GMP-specific phosphodiesterase class I)/GGDEF domain-containing protein